MRELTGKHFIFRRNTVVFTVSVFRKVIKNKLLSWLFFLINRSTIVHSRLEFTELG